VPRKYHLRAGCVPRKWEREYLYNNEPTLLEAAHPLVTGLSHHFVCQSLVTPLFLILHQQAQHKAMQEQADKATEWKRKVFIYFMTRM